MDITYLKSVGTQRAQALNKSDIYSLQDLITYFPVSYITRELAGNINDIAKAIKLQLKSDFTKIFENASQSITNTPQATDFIDKQLNQFNLHREFSIIATITNTKLRSIKNNKNILTITAKDFYNTSFEIIFFSGLSYFVSVCAPNALILVSGKPSFNEFSKQVSFTHPDIEFIEEEDIQTYNKGGIVPKYRITEHMRKTGISNRVLRKIIDNALNIVLNQAQTVLNQKQTIKENNNKSPEKAWLAETLPEDVIAKKQLCSKKTAIECLHNPESLTQIASARYRLKFEEMFWYQLALHTKRKTIAESSRGITITSKSKLARALYNTLPYKLTSDQKKALREIASDIASGKPMNRLLQGDVGSGKTIVAIFSMLMLVEAGYQVAIMCPTEILAEQHYLTIKNLIKTQALTAPQAINDDTLKENIKETGIDALQIELLLGSTRKKLKEEIKNKLQKGELNIIIGTHALLQPDVVFHNLGLIVIDEEHRFGTLHKGAALDNLAISTGCSLSACTLKQLSVDTRSFRNETNTQLPLASATTAQGRALVENPTTSDNLPATSILQNKDLHTSEPANRPFTLKRSIAQAQLAASAPTGQGRALVEHVLFMTATPIPRTITLTLYGDLDVSIIRTMPKNRLPIITYVCFDDGRGKIYQFVRDTIASGRQVYIVYPLVEKSEKLAYKSAVEHYEIISEELFPEFKCGLLHGQMHYRDKEDIMQKFYNNEFNILVSTTVIEVGIDVPNATVMIIEDASRFGLAQLHQLRGRVGRGAEQSYCFLMTKDDYKFKFSSVRDDDLEAEKINSIVRLKAMQTTGDGFKLSEIDMKLRGPGDILGTKQSGLPEFKYIDLVTDIDIIEECKAVISTY